MTGVGSHESTAQRPCACRPINSGSGPQSVPDQSRSHGLQRGTAGLSGGEELCVGLSAHRGQRSVSGAKPGPLGTGSGLAPCRRLRAVRLAVEFRHGAAGGSHDGGASELLTAHPLHARVGPAFWGGGPLAGRGARPRPPPQGLGGAGGGAGCSRAGGLGVLGWRGGRGWEGLRGSRGRGRGKGPQGSPGAAGKGRQGCPGGPPHHRRWCGWAVRLTQSSSSTPPQVVWLSGETDPVEFLHTTAGGVVER